MSELTFEPTPEQFGVLWKYIEMPSVTDIDYNGRELWITDYIKGRYKEDIVLSEQFITNFTHNIANSVNKNFNNANKVLEADTKELRISIIHNSVAATGTTICIRKSPCVVRNTIDSMIRDNYCSEKILNLLINCVRAGMNFVFGGDPGSGKTECAKFFMQFIPKEERVITIEDSLEIHYSEINSGADAVELRISPGFSYTDAIKACLRQNPKWLMLSEARSTEVSALLEQWSTGVNGFTTLHLDDLTKLPDRIINMMDDVKDSKHIENRIYKYVNIGILIRRFTDKKGAIHRKIEQLCFYDRDESGNHRYMIVDDGEIVSTEIPKNILKMFEDGNEKIKDPFICPDFKELREKNR